MEQEKEVAEVQDTLEDTPPLVASESPENAQMSSGFAADPAISGSEDSKQSKPSGFGALIKNKKVLIPVLGVLVLIVALILLIPVIIRAITIGKVNGIRDSFLNDRTEYAATVEELSEYSDNEDENVRNAEKKALHAVRLHEIEALKVRWENGEISDAEVEKAYKEFLESPDQGIKDAAVVAVKEIRSLILSKTEYEAATQAYDAENYEKAFSAFKNVVENDANYEAAQEKLQEIPALWKAKVLENADSYIIGNQYPTAISEIESYLKLFPDEEVSAKLSLVKSKKTEFEKQEQIRKEEEAKQRIINAKNAQLVTVESVSAYDDGYSLVFRKASLVLKNQSDKVVKSATIVLLQFDDNGYPVDAEYSMYQYNSIPNTYCLNANSINMLPGTTWGNNNYWYIADRCTRVKACVASVDFVDGTTWNNTYLSYWLDAEKDRY